MTKSYSLCLTLPKPRNAPAMAARLMKAGSHRPQGGAIRQAHKRRLQAELSESTHSPPAR